jgi:hypothetical protein
VVITHFTLQIGETGGFGLAIIIWNKKFRLPNNAAATGLGPAGFPGLAALGFTHVLGFAGLAALGFTHTLGFPGLAPLGLAPNGVVVRNCCVTKAIVGEVV